MPLTARRSPTAQPWVRWKSRSLVASRSSGASASRGSSARTSSSVKRSSRWRNSVSSPCARRRASEASGGSVRLARTTPQCGGSRSSSRSRNSNTAGSLMRCASSMTIRPRCTSHAASTLSNCVATAWRSLRLPPASEISLSGSVRQGGSSGSSAAIRHARRPSGSSSRSAEIQATNALPRSRCGDQHEATGERRLLHLFFETLAGDETGARARRLDLGQCEALRGRSQGRPPEAYFAVGVCESRPAGRWPSGAALVTRWSSPAMRRTRTRRSRATRTRRGTRRRPAAEARRCTSRW
jgi:hypothetical protein